MRTNNIPIDDLKQTLIGELSKGTKIRCLTTAWIPTDLGLFWIDLRVVGPKAEKSQDDLTLTYGEAQVILEAISDMVKLFKKELRR